MVDSLLAACNSHLAWHSCQHKISWHERQASEFYPTVYVSLISVPIWFAFHIKTLWIGLNKISLPTWISGEINYVQYAELQYPRLFTSLCQSLSTTILYVRLSLRPRLSVYVDCSFYTSSTSTLHSCIVIFLFDSLEYHHNNTGRTENPAPCILQSKMWNTVWGGMNGNSSSSPVIQETGQ
jgi:hypothetical protein